MTFNEIEKEFDENFPCTVLDCDGEGTYADGNGEPNPCRYCHEYIFPIKSFLKQSFIKYLHSEVERWEKQKYNNQEYSEGVPASHYMEGYDKAISDQITHLQAQIKEFEVCP